MLRRRSDCHTRLDHTVIELLLDRVASGDRMPAISAPAFFEVASEEVTEQVRVLCRSDFDPENLETSAANLSLDSVRHQLAARFTAWRPTS